MLRNIPRRLSFFLPLAILLAACGGGGSGTNTLTSEPQSQVFIAGGGVKGPLAFANVELYALDTRFDELFEPGNPIASASTNAYAEITGLPVPHDVGPPYVLVIDGANAIDRNTNEAPVIKKLVTVITEESLAAGQPVYATPYTTLAYHMLRRDPLGGERGNGLQATYYNDTSLSKVALKRVDSTVNFNWKSGSPASAVNPNYFSARWTGMIQPPAAGEYTFYTDADNGVRLWVDGRLLIDRWTDSVAENSAKIHLSGEPNAIRMEYYEKAGGATARLSWSGPGISKSVIPAANLSSGTDAAGRGTDPTMALRMADYDETIVKALGFGMPTETSIFGTPPVINASTTTIESQQKVVQHRAAIEALAGMLHEMATSSQTGTSSDELLDRLAQDLHGDGDIDGAGIDINVLKKDPMNMVVPNTPYRVTDIASVIDDERAMVGSDSNVEFYKDGIIVNLQRATLDARIDNTQVSSDDGSMGNVTNSLLLAGTLATGSVGGEVIYQMDLSKYPENHVLSAQEAAELFNIPGSVPSWFFEGRLIRVENDPFGGSGKVLSIQFRGGTGGTGGDTPGTASGAQWKIGFGGKSYEELYMSMELGVDGKWVSPRGMHLPFLASDPFAASTTADPDIWASFLQLIGNNSYVNSITRPINRNLADDSIAMYYYSLTDAQKYAWWNTDAPTRFSPSNLPHNGQVTLVRNGYVKLEQRLKLNSVSASDKPNSDGAMQAWANGRLAIDEQNVVWRRDAAQKMDYAWFLFWTGGGANKAEWFQPKEQKMFVKSFVISTKPITH